MEEGSRRRLRVVLLVPSLAFVVDAPSIGIFWPMVALLGLGTAVVVLILGLFLTNERYRRPPKPDRGVGFVEARLTVENQVSSLAPRVLLLAEKEETIVRFLESRALSNEARRDVEGLLQEAATGFWRRFGAASALVEDDPAKACEELRLLVPVVETVVERLSRAEEVCIDGVEVEPLGRG